MVASKYAFYVRYSYRKGAKSVRTYILCPIVFHSYLSSIYYRSLNTIGYITHVRIHISTPLSSTLDCPINLFSEKKNFTTEL